MNDTQVVDSHIIRDIVLSAQEAISDAFTPLVDADETTRFANATTDLQAQVENIGMIAEMSGLQGLNATCIQFAAQIADLPLSSSQDALFVQEHMNAWLLDTLTYLENWQSRENIELLTRHLTANSYDVCRLLLSDIEQTRTTEEITFPEEDNVVKVMDGDDLLDENIIDNNINIDNEVSIFSAADAEVVNVDINSETLNFPADDEALDIDIDDVDAMFAEDDIDLDSLDGVMALLCQEIRELQPQISALTQKLVSSDDADALEASTAYKDIVARIHNTSDGLGLSGLVHICDFVLKNISLVLAHETELRVKSQGVLAGWPQVVIDHLQTPDDDDLCLAVVDYLEDTSWPEPLKYSEIRDLIDGLTTELELTGDYEVDERSKEATAEDVLLEIAEDTNQQLLDAIFAEAPGYAEELTMRIADIVNGIEVLENTKAAQRISHSLKGSANLIGTKGIANLAHHLEDIFEYLAKKLLPPPEPLAYTMQEAADTIEVMIEFLQGLSPAPNDALRILQDVLNWANRIDKGHLTRDTDIILSIPSTNIQDRIEQTDTAGHATTQPLTQTEFLHVPRDTIDQIFNMVGETSIAISQVQEQLKRMHERGDDMSKQDHTLQTRRFELENLISIRGMATQRLHAVTDDGHFDSLEMDQYDEFYGATHSFIEAASDTRESSRDLATNIMELEGLFLQQQRLNHSLQNLVMTTRMVPVKTVVARLQRAVRQTCRATNKQVELEVIGENLLMDRDVLNQLTDPLSHILRNAIDHGIELPEERLEKDKPRGGHIALRFYQEGNSIRVSCSDDGTGLDYERIRQIATERNLINLQEETDHATLARMILSSGFSTRDKATQISGRGVGMDVVHTAVLHLKGSIDITDNLPAGTNVNLRLPITMLTSHSILVKSEDQRYAIPTSMLDQILPPGTGQFSTLGGNQTFQLGKDVYPAKSLAQLLGLQVAANSSNSNASTVLLVRFGSEIYAVTVEYVVSNYDLVVKNPGQYVKHVPGIAGVALLGDGGVVPVLDIVELLDAQKPGRLQTVQPVSNASDEKAGLAKVLIVDDSLSMRKSLSLLIQDAGYLPIVARDGIEALESMQKTMPNLILTDLEMPRMTGLELATHVRSNPDNKKVPIMMITSRTMSKHREQAKKAGVDEYLTKPFSEDALVEKIGAALHG